MNKYNVKIIFEGKDIKAEKIINAISSFKTKIKKGKVSPVSAEAKEV